MQEWILIHNTQSSSFSIREDNLIVLALACSISSTVTSTLIWLFVVVDRDQGKSSSKSCLALEARHL